MRDLSKVLIIGMILFFTYKFLTLDFFIIIALGWIVVPVALVVCAGIWDKD